MSLFYLFLLFLFFKVYKESLDKLQSMLVTLEGKMKDILKENEEKQKVFNIEQKIITFTLHPLPPSPFSLLSLFLSSPFLLSLLPLPLFQLLRSSPLLAERRNLFVYFFTDPEKLTAVMASLTHRVDTLATAVELTDTQTND